MSIYLSFDQQKLQFIAKEKDFVLLIESANNKNNLDLAYFKILNKLAKLNKEKNILESSTIDQIPFEFKNYEWTKDNLLINSKKLIKKGDFYIRNFGDFSLTLKKDTDYFYFINL